MYSLLVIFGRTVWECVAVFLLLSKAPDEWAEAGQERLGRTHRQREELRGVSLGLGDLSETWRELDIQNGVEVRATWHRVDE